MYETLEAFCKFSQFIMDIIPADTIIIDQQQSITWNLFKQAFNENLHDFSATIIEELEQESSTECQPFVELPANAYATDDSMQAQFDYVESVPDLEQISDQKKHEKDYVLPIYARNLILKYLDL